MITKEDPIYVQKKLRVVRHKHDDEHKAEVFDSGIRVYSCVGSNQDKVRDLAMEWIQDNYRVI
jgi:hypothetical protein